MHKITHIVKYKKSVLPKIDEILRTREPFVEYLLTKPAWNIKLSEKCTTAQNPYGHSSIIYSLPNSKNSTLMNVSGIKRSDLIYWFNPSEYIFAKKPGEGDQQGEYLIGASYRFD